MAEDFDPYRKWLGIPPKDQPPHHYRLLGIATFEDDPDVIENAASRQMAHVRTFQSGKHGPISQRLLNELTAAKLCLLQPPKKQAYDAALRQTLAAAGQLSSSGVMDAAVEEEVGFPPPPPADFRAGDGRWRTNQDAAPEFPSVGVAPVPIPMPPAAPPVAVSSSLSGAQKIRHKGYSANSSRGRKSSSAVPMLLMMGAVGLLAFGGIVAVLISLNNQPVPTPPKQPLAHEKNSPKRPSSSSNTPFTVGSNNRPPRPQPNRPENPLANRPQPPDALPMGTEPTPPNAEQSPREFLTLARRSLEQRNDNDFRFQISQAGFLVAQQKPADAEALKAEEAHLRDIERLLNDFWQAVAAGADKKIPKGEKISFKRHQLEIVSREGDQLRYKFDGVEQVTSTKKLPPRVAMYIALRVFGQENLDGKIALVIFQLIDAEASRDIACQRLAGRLLEDIEKAGVSENPILQRERDKAIRPPENKDEELSGPLIIGSTAPETATGDKPFDPKIGAAVANAPPKLDPMLMKEAREKFEKEFRSRLLDAAEKLADNKTLLTELTSQIATAETNEFKVKLLKEACELAAKLGDSESVVKASEQIAALGGEPALETQLQIFNRVSLDLPGTAKELLAHAQTAASQAEKDGNLFAAVELLKIAKRAAEKAKLTVETEVVQQKLEAAEKARAEMK